MSSSFHITTLVDNLVYGKKLQAEHGLSLYIETKSHRLLFDTGQSDLFLRNARFLHIDIADIDYLILSHAHYDHTGGLLHFLRQNAKARIVCKREILRRKQKRGKLNGLPTLSEEELARFIFIDKFCTLVPGVALCPHLPIVYSDDTHFHEFFVERHGKWVADQFDDELALVLNDSDSYHVVSACSHRGISNILAAVEYKYPHHALRTIIGGFHIHKAGVKAVENIISHLPMPLPQIYTGHCTGVEQYAFLHSLLDSPIYYNHVGNTINI